MDDIINTDDALNDGDVINEMIGVKEASAYLGISENQTVLLADVGEIEGHRQNDGWLITHASIVAYKARRMVLENTTQSLEDWRD